MANTNFDPRQLLQGEPEEDLVQQPKLDPDEMPEPLGEDEEPEDALDPVAQQILNTKPAPKAEPKPAPAPRPEAAAAPAPVIAQAPKPAPKPAPQLDLPEAEEGTADLQQEATVAGSTGDENPENTDTTTQGEDPMATATKSKLPSCPTDWTTLKRRKGKPPTDAYVKPSYVPKTGWQLDYVEKGTAGSKALNEVFANGKTKAPRTPKDPQAPKAAKAPRAPKASAPRKAVAVVSSGNPFEAVNTMKQEVDQLNEQISALEAERDAKQAELDGFIGEAQKFLAGLKG